ncbi:serine hydrolase [Bernardetia sp. ABR2-2B]|uniref:serine hydrolase n=1 Tax=Bernardetia sp. ABR2-2B TaxID=3127472 RepID=UPI0030D088E5
MQKSIILLSLLLFFTNCTSKKVAKTEANQSYPQSYSKKIDSLLKIAYKRDIFNGTILVMKNDSLVYQNAFGYTDVNQSEKLTENSIFNTGSIAKEFNAVAIMMLVEQGLLDLDDPISKFELGLPKWSEKITIKHLLNYTGGLPAVERNVSSDEDAMKNLQNLKNTLFEAGTNFNYNNNSVFIQRRIIEKITQQSFQEFVTQNIIEPLEMTNSVFDPKADYPNRTSCYSLEKEACPEMSFISGWLWVDINDMYKWINALNTNKLITAVSLQILLKNPYVDNKTSSIGIYNETAQTQMHDGTSFSFESIFINDFKENIVVILLSNYKNQTRPMGVSIHNLMKDKPYRIPKKSVAQAIKKQTIENVDKGIKAYFALKEESEGEYGFDNPSELNNLGYELIRLEKNKEAIELFQLAIKEFPKNANIFDSMGEAYFIDKQYDLALENYNMAVKLGGTNGNAKSMIEKIEKLQSK